MSAILKAFVIVLICFVRGDNILLNEGKGGSIENPPHNAEGDTLRIINREEWRGQAHGEPLQDLELPIPNVIIWHTSTNPCYDFKTCSNIVRIVQHNHMSIKHWWDIGFNFLIGGDGNVYEGRGWLKVGAHTYGWNAKSIGIGFIGMFDNTMPTSVQIKACKKLLEEGVSLGILDKDYKLVGARQLSGSSCPGQKLYEDIKNWPHWSSLS